MAKTLTFKKVKYEILDNNSLRVAKNTKFAGPLVIPETIEKNGIVYTIVAIENWAFHKSGITSVEIPGSVKEITFMSFSETPLESVTLHNGVEKIDNYAFSFCKITTIHIPGSVNTIRVNAFEGCCVLTDVTFDNPAGITEVLYSSFEGTPWLSNQMKQSDSLVIGSTLVGVHTNDKQYTIPEGIEAISPFAFEKCSNLKEVSFPEGITELAYGVFNRCGSLERINLPNSLKVIGSRAGEILCSEGTFNACHSLKDIVLPEGIEVIGSASFKDCSSLRSIHLPKTLKTLGNYVFEGCASLKELRIPDGITELLWNVCTGCASLKTVILPESLIKIGHGAFKDCYRLSSITLPHSIKEIGSEAFWECYDLSSIELPDGLEVVGNGAFGICNSLSTIRLPKSIKSVGKNAFWSCIGLMEVLTSDGEAVNNKEVFSNCPNLGKKTSKGVPASATLEIMADPYECECFINLSEKDVAPYMNENYSDPNEGDFSSTLVSFVEWGRYREAYLDDKEIPFETLFFRPMEYYQTKWTEPFDDLQKALSVIKKDSYGIIDRREMYKSLMQYHIDLNGIPFNKYGLKLLRISERNKYSPIPNKIVPHFSMSHTKLLYCGKEVEGELLFDMGSQGKVNRIVFYKDKDGEIKIIGEYTY